MIFSTVNVSAQTIMFESYSDVNEGTIYYTDEEGMKISDLYDVSGVVQLNSSVDNGGIATRSMWRAAQFPSTTLQPGYQYMLMEYITYECYENVNIVFRTSRDCDIVVGLNAAGSDTVYATKQVSCKANQLNTVSIGLGGGKTVTPFILNANGVSVGLSDVAVHYFLCD